MHINVTRRICTLYARNNYCQAYTLVEVLITVVILSVAILAWVSTQQSSVMTRGQSRTMTVATELVRAKIEELSLRPAGICGMGTTFCNGEDEFSLGGFTYALQWEMERFEVFGTSFTAETNSGETNSTETNGTIEDNATLEGDETVLLDVRPYWEIYVQADWNYRGSKSISATRVVMEKGL